MREPEVRQLLPQVFRPEPDAAVFQQCPNDGGPDGSPPSRLIRDLDIKREFHTGREERL